MFVPAVIKLDSLERFLFSSSAAHSQWAKTLYLLGTTLNEIPGLEVAGVAPDFGDWYVCFYLSLGTEEQTIKGLRSALKAGGANPLDCVVVQKAREFGRKSGYRRAIMRIKPESAGHLAEILHDVLPKTMAFSLAG